MKIPFYEMKIWNTQIITDLTGLRGATLTRFCSDLGFEGGRQGAARQLGLGDVMTLLLAHHLLTEHGLRRDEAIGLARQVRVADWQSIVEGGRPAWLFARRLGSPEEWTGQVVDHRGAGQLLRQTETVAWIVISLPALAHRTLLAQLSATADYLESTLPPKDSAA
jgi:hypothetical protein